MRKGRLIAMSFGLAAAAMVPASSAFAQAEKSATPKSGSIGIRLITAPNATPDELSDSPYIVDRLGPGSSVTRTVEIDNDSANTVAVSIYPAAASIVRGNFAFAAGSGENDLSTWTSVSKDKVPLWPGGEVTDVVTINVPDTASAGEQYAVLWAQVSTPSTSGSSGITLVSRVGIRIYLTVGAGGAPPPSFAIGKLSAERSTSGRPLVVTTVDNTGQSTLDLRGSLMLSKGPGGLGDGPFAATVGAILAPGVAEPVTVQLASGLPRGPWRADLGLTSGTPGRSTSAMITFPAEQGAVRSPHSRDWVEPSIVLAVFLLLAITSAGLIARRRRRTAGTAA
jgi:hypothetical protein